MAFPIFTNDEVNKFENYIDRHIKAGKSQICISTGFISAEMKRLQSYLAFYYRSGSFSPSGNTKNYLVAKNGKKLNKVENATGAFNYQ